MYRKLTLVSLALAACAFIETSSAQKPPQPSTPPPAQRAPVREIVHVKGDLYRARTGNWYTAFLVTPVGIVLGDPINVGFADWLKAELDKQFPGKPVRYVIYSHSHFDHAEGGGAFAATATFVGHENMARNLDGRYPQMPGDMVDRNNNGVIDRDEIDLPTTTRLGVCGMFIGFFDTIDRNHDGVATPQELLAYVVKPTVLYSDRMRIELGGKVVELVHPGLNHSDDATVLYFPSERAAFVTEFVADALVNDNVRSLPSACGPFDGNPLAEWIKSYKAVEALDFDVLLTGHGAPLLDKSAVRETREYFEYLRDQVSAGIAAGKSLDDLKRTITLDRYKTWANYDRLRTYNVEAAYLNLKLYR